MNVPTVSIDPDEEIALCCGLMFYQPTGYYSNPWSLWKDLVWEGFQFPFKKVRDWLINQNEWQKYAPLPKDIPRVSYGKISHPNCVHQCDLLRLMNDKIYKKIFKWVLNVIDVTSRYKNSIPLTSKNSSEVARAFEKIYDNSNIPLTWPELLQYDGGREFMGETA